MPSGTPPWPTSTRSSVNRAVDAAGTGAHADGGLTWAVSRHATTRSRPQPHDHVLLGNVVKMLDEGAVGRRSTPPCYVTTSTPPPLSGVWPRRQRRSSSAMGSKPTPARRDAWGAGPYRVSPNKPGRCTPPARPDQCRRGYRRLLSGPLGSGPGHPGPKGVRSSRRSSPAGATSWAGPASPRPSCARQWSGLPWHTLRPTRR